MLLFLAQSSGLVKRSNRSFGSFYRLMQRHSRYLDEQAFVEKMFRLFDMNVAARRKESADSFAQKLGIPTAYGSYEELAKDSRVEIVYVGTVHPQHYAACMMFLEHGKHVLCEKPMGISLQECKEVIAKAREKKLFFMEGYWTRFFPVVDVMREELKSGSLGNINFLRVGFCVCNKNMERISKKELGGGGLLDLGCYLVQYANLVYRDRPDKIMAVGDLNEEVIEYHIHCAGMTECPLMTHDDSLYIMEVMEEALRQTGVQYSR
nr:hypothetical protein BaRGS_034690 [Batillaria attramentaria]